MNSLECGRREKLRLIQIRVSDALAWCRIATGEELSEACAELDAAIAEENAFTSRTLNAIHQPADE